jgi:thiol-disulfide isomerase/thioredoxin
MLIKNIISYDDLLNYIKTYKHIFINISANWCKPCNEIKPLIEKFVSVINENNVIYLKLNHTVYDDDDSFNHFFGMKKIPYFGYIKDGELITSFVSGDFPFVSKKIYEYIAIIKSEENSEGNNKSSNLDIISDF